MIIRRAFKILGKIAVTLSLLLLILILVFSIPRVQTKAAHKLTDYLNTELGTEIKIDRISVTFGAQINIKNAYIGDHHNDTLITAKSIKTSLINIPGLIRGKYIDFGDVTADGLTFRLRRYEGDDKDSFGIFLDKLQNKNSDKDQRTRIKFKRLYVMDGKFSFVDYQGQYPEIVGLKNLSIDVSEFIIEGGDISIDIRHLEGDERRGMHVDNLSTKFKLRDDLMYFDDFNLKTPNSDLRGVFHFSFEHTMRDFENHVNIDANFDQASISTTDLHYFYDKFGNGQKLNFNGKMEGVLNDFVLQDFSLSGMSNTGFNGRVHIKNIFGDKKFRLDGNFNYLETDYNDLVNLLPPLLKKPLPEELERFGRTRLIGSLGTDGTMVETNSSVKTEIGNAKLDVQLTNLQQKGNEKYKGIVEVEDFDLSKLLENPQFGKASFTFKMEGKGLEPKSLHSNLDGNFSKLTYNNYTYHDIDIKGELKNPVFNGQIKSKDPNLQMTFDGMADLSGDHNDYLFNAQVKRADLHAMNFKKKVDISVFKGNVTLNIHGNDIDDMVGTINLQNASYQNPKDTYEFEELILSSNFQDDVRRISINSPDIINGYVEGRFNLTEIPDLLKNAIGDLYSNYSPVEIADNQYLDFNIAIHNKVVEALYPFLSLAGNTNLDGKIHAKNSSVKVNFKSPQISVFDNEFKNVTLQLDNTDPLSTTYFNVDRVVSKTYNLSKVNLISKRRNDTLYVRSELKGGDHDEDNFKFSLYHTINKNNESVVGINRSKLRFQETTWFLNEEKENQTITFDARFNHIKVNGLTLTQKDQKISFEGDKSGRNTKNFGLNFQNVDLNKVTPSLKNFKMNGTLNGALTVEQNKDGYFPASDISIHNLALNDIDYGNFTLDVEGNKSLTSYTVNAKMAGEEFNYMTADGEVSVGKGNSKVDLDIELNKFKLGFLNAIGKGVVSHIRGVASGKAHFGGDFRKPNISGGLNLKGAGIKVPYLNVDLALEENASVKLQDEGFYFDHVDVEDIKYHTKGQIDGTIGHTYFKNWRLDLYLDAPNRLLVLDTEYSDESLYYGTAYINGNVQLLGPFDELVIDVNATTEKGTVFKIPLNDAATLADNDFIYFLSPEEKKARKEGRDIIFRRLKGLELNFELDVTDDAEIEIVVDKKSGSTLKGTGAGTLLMEINTNGKFNMWGDYVVYDGVYNFRYAGLIEKQFEVVSGGNITWDGSPTQANLDVRGKYETEANPASLLENPTVNRSIPINVYIDLSGMLTDVDIDFELEYPNLSSVVKSELEYRISDRENTELQALSLITQRSFYSEMEGGRTAHPENLLFERAAGLFNDIFSDSEDKFQVGVDYTKGNRAPDQEISDRVGVTLSTNVSDRVLINGKVGVPIGGLTQSVVVGDIEMEILLNEEGTLRAKVFNRESDIQYIGEELGYTQGIGLSYSVDFDTFKEMISKILNKEIKVDNIPEKVEEEEKENLVPDYIKFPSN